MNKMIKILLSVLMVSLNALFIHLNEKDICNETDFAAEQEKIVEQETIMKMIPQLHCKHVTTLYIKEIKNDYEKAIEEMARKLENIGSIDDKLEWFLAYKSIIDEYKDFYDPPETIYDIFTDEELDLLFRVVQAEIGDEYSFEQKVNVASVIFNRLKHDRFPDDLFEILIPSQFSPISSGRYKTVEVSDVTIWACEYAFQFEDTTGGCLFFDSNGVLKYDYVDNDGAHNFYKLRE